MHNVLAESFALSLIARLIRRDAFASLEYATVEVMNKYGLKGPRARAAVVSAAKQGGFKVVGKRIVDPARSEAVQPKAERPVKVDPEGAFLREIAVPAGQEEYLRGRLQSLVSPEVEAHLEGGTVTITSTSACELGNTARRIAGAIRKAPRVVAQQAKALERDRRAKAAAEKRAKALAEKAAKIAERENARAAAAAEIERRRIARADKAAEREALSRAKTAPPRAEPTRAETAALYALSKHAEHASRAKTPAGRSRAADKARDAARTAAAEMIRRGDARPLSTIAAELYHNAIGTDDATRRVEAEREAAAVLAEQVRRETKPLALAVKKARAKEAAARTKVARAKAAAERLEAESRLAAAVAPVVRAMPQVQIEPEAAAAMLSVDRVVEEARSVEPVAAPQRSASSTAPREPFSRDGVERVELPSTVDDLASIPGAVASLFDPDTVTVHHRTSPITVRKTGDLYEASSGSGVERQSFTSRKPQDAIDMVSKFAETNDLAAPDLPGGKYSREKIDKIVAFLRDSHRELDEKIQDLLGSWIEEEPSSRKVGSLTFGFDDLQDLREEATRILKAWKDDDKSLESDIRDAFRAYHETSAFAAALPDQIRSDHAWLEEASKIAKQEVQRAWQAIESEYNALFSGYSTERMRDTNVGTLRYFHNLWHEDTLPQAAPDRMGLLSNRPIEQRVGQYNLHRDYATLPHESDRDNALNEFLQEIQTAHAAASQEMSAAAEKLREEDGERAETSSAPEPSAMPAPPAAPGEPVGTRASTEEPEPAEAPATAQQEASKPLPGISPEAMAALDLPIDVALAKVKKFKGISAPFKPKDKQRINGPEGWSWIDAEPSPSAFFIGLRSDGKLTLTHKTSGLSVLSLPKETRSAKHRLSSISTMRALLAALSEVPDNAELDRASTPWRDVASQALNSVAYEQHAPLLLSYLIQPPGLNDPRHRYYADRHHRVEDAKRAVEASLREGEIGTLLDLIDDARFEIQENHGGVPTPELGRAIARGVKASSEWDQIADDHVRGVYDPDKIARVIPEMRECIGDLRSLVFVSNKKAVASQRQALGPHTNPSSPWGRAPFDTYQQDPIFRAHTYSADPDVIVELERAIDEVKRVDAALAESGRSPIDRDVMSLAKAELSVYYAARQAEQEIRRVQDQIQEARTQGKTNPRILEDLERKIQSIKSDWNLKQSASSLKAGEGSPAGRLVTAKAAIESAIREAKETLTKQVDIDLERDDEQDLRGKIAQLGVLDLQRRVAEMAEKVDAMRVGREFKLITLDGPESKKIRKTIESAAQPFDPYDTDGARRLLLNLALAAQYLQRRADELEPAVPTLERVGAIRKTWDRFYDQHKEALWRDDPRYVYPGSVWVLLGRLDTSITEMQSRSHTQELQAHQIIERFKPLFEAIDREVQARGESLEEILAAGPRAEQAPAPAPAPAAPREPMAAPSLTEKQRVIIDYWRNNRNRLTDEVTVAALCRDVRMPPRSWSPKAVHAELLSMARSGMIELRADSGFMLTSPADKALSIPGPHKTTLTHYKALGALRGDSSGGPSEPPEPPAQPEPPTPAAEPAKARAEAAAPVREPEPTAPISKPSKVLAFNSVASEPEAPAQADAPELSAPVADTEDPDAAIKTAVAHMGRGAMISKIRDDWRRLSKRLEQEAGDGIEGLDKQAIGNLRGSVLFTLSGEGIDTSENEDFARILIRIAQAERLLDEKRGRQSPKAATPAAEPAKARAETPAPVSKPSDKDPSIVECLSIGDDEARRLFDQLEELGDHARHEEIRLSRSEAIIAERQPAGTYAAPDPNNPGSFALYARSNLGSVFYERFDPMIGSVDLRTARYLARVLRNVVPTAQELGRVYYSQAHTLISSSPAWGSVWWALYNNPPSIRTSMPRAIAEAQEKIRRSKVVQDEPAPKFGAAEAERRKAFDAALLTSEQALEKLSSLPELRKPFKPSDKVIALLDDKPIECGVEVVGAHAVGKRGREYYLIAMRDTPRVIDIYHGNQTAEKLGGLAKARLAVRILSRGANPSHMMDLIKGSTPNAYQHLLSWYVLPPDSTAQPMAHIFEAEEQKTLENMILHLRGEIRRLSKRPDYDRQALAKYAEHADQCTAYVGKYPSLDQSGRCIRLLRSDLEEIKQAARYDYALDKGHEDVDSRHASVAAATYAGKLEQLSREARNDLGFAIEYMHGFDLLGPKENEYRAAIQEAARFAATIHNTVEAHSALEYRDALAAFEHVVKEVRALKNEAKQASETLKIGREALTVWDSKAMRAVLDHDRAGETNAITNAHRALYEAIRDVTNATLHKATWARPGGIAEAVAALREPVGRMREALVSTPDALQNITATIGNLALKLEKESQEDPWNGANPLKEILVMVRPGVEENRPVAWLGHGRVFGLVGTKGPIDRHDTRPSAMLVASGGILVNNGQRFRPFDWPKIHEAVQAREGSKDRAVQKLLKAGPKTRDELKEAAKLITVALEPWASKAQ